MPPVTGNNAGVLSLSLLKNSCALLLIISTGQRYSIIIADNYELFYRLAQVFVSGGIFSSIVPSVLHWKVKRILKSSAQNCFSSPVEGEGRKALHHRVFEIFLKSIRFTTLPRLPDEEKNLKPSSKRLLRLHWKLKTDVKQERMQTICTKSCHRN